MNTATPDPETPIFGEVREELGIPEIDVHDFEVHRDEAGEQVEAENRADSSGESNDPADAAASQEPDAAEDSPDASVEQSTGDESSGE